MLPKNQKDNHFYKIEDKNFSIFFHYIYNNYKAVDTETAISVQIADFSVQIELKKGLFIPKLRYK